MLDHTYIMMPCVFCLSANARADQDVNGLDYCWRKAVTKQLAAIKQAAGEMQGLTYILLAQMTTSYVYVVARRDASKGRRSHFDTGAKVHWRLLPIGQTALSNLLTEDVLQQILSCTLWLDCRTHVLHAHTHTHMHTVQFHVVIPRHFSAAQCELWGLRWSRTKH